MKVAAVVALSACACEAFCPSMTANSGLSRTDFAKVLAAGVAGVATPALALGATPKQSFFGIFGFGAPVVGGGGQSSPYAETETYSPYSPYSATDDGTAVYKGPSDEMTKQYIAVLKDCQTRFKKIPQYTAKKQWLEVTAELTRKAYVLRASMNALAGKSPEGVAAAKQYYKDLEIMTVEATRKNGSAVLAAYEKSVQDLNVFLAAI